MRPHFRAALALGLAAALLLGAWPRTAPAAESGYYDRETPVVRAVRRAGPAVVNISSRQVVAGRAHPFGRDEFFERFFKDFFPFPREYTRNSLGSGVVIDGLKKLVLTNEHVVAQATEIKVSLGDEDEFSAKVVGSDPDSDLAVLEVETDRVLPALEMGDSSDLMIGETVIAIGNPFGLSHTVTTGVISALDRSVRAGDRVYRDFIQTDASINPGNSGGPLLNINGELIGINTAIYGGAEGIGFAIPIDKAKRIIKELIAHGGLKPVWLGLALQPVDERLARYFNLSAGHGVLVTGLDPAGPAAVSGLAAGDVIVALGDSKVLSLDDYEDILHGYTDGSQVKVTALHEGRKQDFQITARPFPQDKADALGWERYGIEVAPGKDESSEYPGHVVVKKVRPGSPAQAIGLRPGDLISQVNEMKTGSVESFLAAMAKYHLRQALSLVVYRGRWAYQVTLAP
ncbi:MAG: trypsin-like peptidase domain-containing protein [Thermodesulfobacteriota bacterium]